MAVGNAIPAEGTTESLTQTLRVAMLGLLEEANKIERAEREATAAARQPKG